MRYSEIVIRFVLSACLPTLFFSCAALPQQSQEEGAENEAAQEAEAEEEAPAESVEIIEEIPQVYEEKPVFSLAAAEESEAEEEATDEEYAVAEAYPADSAESLTEKREAPSERPPVVKTADGSVNTASLQEEGPTKAEVKEDVAAFVRRLNILISARKYNDWKLLLSPEFFGKINSRAYLDQIGQTPRFKFSKEKLKNARDYFERVVVPARANYRVDDIDMTGPDTVTAYTIEVTGHRLKLYELVRYGDSWRITGL